MRSGATGSWCRSWGKLGDCSPHQKTQRWLTAAPSAPLSGSNDEIEIVAAPNTNAALAALAASGGPPSIFSTVLPKPKPQAKGKADAHKSACVG
jgi:hypothetical protein